MKIVSINASNFGSTGNIMLGISRVAERNGETAYIGVANSRSNQKKKIENQIFIGNLVERNLHLLLAKYTGFNGCLSHLGTFRFLKKLDKINPDVMHLHNLHNCYINLPMLFRWIKKRKIKVIWTLHDCWAFTGQCPHFQIANCDKWKTGCHDCPQYKAYPQSYVDRTKTMYRLKKKWFTGVADLTIVTPSNWLADLVRESFLKEYPIKVIHNGIDLEVFRPIESDIRKRLGIENKTVLLGCASPWSNRKGLDVFIELAERLDETYQIVLVGLSKEQIATLPQNIIGIERTSSAEELAKYYSMADIFVNPTKEEVLGLVNIEALACGTPVITFDAGGSPECINETCGVVVSHNNIDAWEQAIEYVREAKPFKKKNCINRSKAFDKIYKFNVYIDLFYAGV